MWSGLNEKKRKHPSINIDPSSTAATLTHTVAAYWAEVWIKSLRHGLVQWLATSIFVWFHWISMLIIQIQFSVILFEQVWISWSMMSLSSSPGTLLLYDNEKLQVRFNFLRQEKVTWFESNVCYQVLCFLHNCSSEGNFTLGKYIDEALEKCYPEVVAACRGAFEGKFNKPNLL